MISYIVRRLLYALPILVGVNVITFALFFLVNTPDDMARMQLGAKRVTPEAIANWKQERGYDLPLLYNAGAQGMGRVTRTIFYEKSLRMFVFDFGRADDGRDIAREIRMRMGPSLAVAVPAFFVGLLVYITCALGFAFLHIGPEAPGPQGHVDSVKLPQHTPVHRAFFGPRNRPREAAFGVIAAADEGPAGSRGFQMQATRAAGLANPGVAAIVAGRIQMRRQKIVDLVEDFGDSQIGCFGNRR